MSRSKDVVVWEYAVFMDFYRRFLFLWEYEEVEMIQEPDHGCKNENQRSIMRIYCSSSVKYVDIGRRGVFWSDLWCYGAEVVYVL